MHFGKSVVPRVGRPSTGLALLLIYADPSPSSASRTTIQAQILQFLPSADQALYKDLGVEEGGVILGRTACWQAFSESGLAPPGSARHGKEQILPYPSPAGLGAETPPVITATFGQRASPAPPRQSLDVTPDALVLGVQVRD